MDLLNTDSWLGIALVVVWLLVGATVGVTLFALVFAEAWRRFYSARPDRDEELTGSGAGA